jgi:hypothetical protein
MAGSLLIAFTSTKWSFSNNLVCFRTHKIVVRELIAAGMPTCVSLSNGIRLHRTHFASARRI